MLIPCNRRHEDEHRQSPRPGRLEYGGIRCLFEDLYVVAIVPPAACGYPDSVLVPPEHLLYVEIEKVAKLVSYLSTEDASIVNGACWTADGGWTAN